MQQNLKRVNPTQSNQSYSRTSPSRDLASPESISRFSTNVIELHVDTESLDLSQQQTSTISDSSDSISELDTMQRNLDRVSAAESEESYGRTSQFGDRCSVCFEAQSVMMGFVHDDSIHVCVCQHCFKFMNVHAVNQQGRIMKRCPLCNIAAIANLVYRA